MIPGVLQRIAKAYAVDPRSLALLRMLVGLGFVITRIINLPWVTEFYTDRGSYPRRFTQLLITHPQGPSLFKSVGEPSSVFFFYFLAICAGAAVALGFKTRQSTVVCWLLAISIYNRCPAINPASDAEICLCLFFGCFLPWGAVWSVDHPHPIQEQADPYLSAAVLGWRIQVSALYLTASMSKTSFHWGNGTATLVSISSDFWSSHLGRWAATILGPHPVLARELTSVVVLMEFMLPFLLLLPVVQIQIFALIVLVGVHIAFGLALHLEAFTPLAIACLAGFIPGLLWPRLRPASKIIERFFQRITRRGATGRGTSGLTSLDPYSSAFISWALFGVIWSCSTSVNPNSPRRLPIRMMEVWHAFGLEQSWGMFNPPPFQGGWFVFRGLTMRGDWVNLEYPGEEVDTLSVPIERDRSVPTSRHVLLYNSLLFKAKQMEPLQERIAQDFRIRWELQHPEPLDRIRKVEIYKFYREFDPESGRFSKPEMTYKYSKNLF